MVCARRAVIVVALLVVAVATVSARRQLSWQESTDANDYYRFRGVLVFCQRVNSSGSVVGVGYRDGLAAGGACVTPGPLLSLVPGYNYLLTFVNAQPDVASNLHTHGLHLSGEGNADNVMREAPAGTCLGYNLSLPRDHSPGTYFYHTHVSHGSWRQLSNGAMGMIVVEDIDPWTGALLPLPPLSRALPGYTAAQAAYSRVKTLLSSGPRVMAARVAGQPLFYDYSGDDDDDDAAFALPALTWTRLRLAVVEPSGTRQDVQLRSANGDAEPPCQARVLAYDGIYRSTVPGPSSDTLQWSVAAAGRLDLLLRCWQDVNVTLFDGAAFTLRLLPPADSDNCTDHLDHWTPLRAAYLTDLADSTVASYHTVQASSMYMVWDDQHYRYPTAPYSQANCSSSDEEDGTAAALRLGDVMELTVFASTLHPLHLHVHPMQIAGEACDGHEDGQFYDTISTTGSSCTVRVRPLDYPGHAFLHCHNTMHADMGAKTVLYICPTDSQSIDNNSQDPPVDSFTCSIEH